MRLVQCYLSHVIENNNNAKGTTMNTRTKSYKASETIFFGIYVNDLKLRSFPEAKRALLATGRITWVGVEIVRLSSTKYSVNGAQVHGVPQAFREAAKLAASGAPLPVYGLYDDGQLDAEFELLVGTTRRKFVEGVSDALASKPQTSKGPRVERVSLEALRELRKCSFCQHLVFAANSLKGSTPWDIEVKTDRDALDLYYEVEILGYDKRTGEAFRQYKNEHTSARCSAVIRAALAKA